MNNKLLLKALEDDQNEKLFSLTKKKIRENNLNVIKDLPLNKQNIKEIMHQLKDYKYIDEMNDLKYGTYIRWISLNEPNNIYLTKGAIFCEVKITDEGVFCVCKNFGFSPKYFQIMMDENLIFQKLTEQEKVLLSAIEHLSK
jgi:hypothetical protein